MTAEPLPAARRSGPAPSNACDVVTVTAAEIRELRRHVLRRGTPTDNVKLPADDAADTVHLAIRDRGAIVATSTWSEARCALRPETRAVQLRAMAVHDDHQRRGLGAVLVAAGVSHAQHLGVRMVWANARDTALDFYVAQGFEVVGDGFLTEDTRIPHHVVIRYV